ncbi:hypothetical protein C8F01DRAFT_1234745 [Mycena amicta]|nr:hypothetical protein C8F01DRAFT_1234745 [Mycena amicta]
MGTAKDKCESINTVRTQYSRSMVRNKAVSACGRSSTEPRGKPVRRTASMMRRACLNTEEGVVTHPLAALWESFDTYNYKRVAISISTDLCPNAPLCGHMNSIAAFGFTINPNELGAKMPQSPPAFIAVAVVQLSKPFSRHTSSHIQVDAPSCRPFKPPPSMPKAAVDAASRPSLRQRSQGWINTPPRPPPPPSTTSSSHSSKTGVMLVTPGSRLSPRIPGSVPPLAALQVPVPAVICGCQTSSPSFECVPSVSTSSRPSFDDSWQTTAVTTRPSAPSPPSRGPSSFDLRLSAVHALVRLLTNSLSSYSLSDCSIFQVV